MRGRLLLLIGVLALVASASVSAASLDVIRGTRGPDTLNGTAGGDLIYARAGNDAVRGHDGGDVIFAGSDNLLEVVQPQRRLLFGEQHARRNAELERLNDLDRLHCNLS